MHQQMANALAIPNRTVGLIYASGPTDTYILSYPDGNLINSFQTGRPPSICSNDKGQVFIPESEKLLKYKHGGAKPIATLNDKGFEPEGCAADATSGSLAVTNFRSTSFGPGNVALYANGSNKPNFLADPSITNYYFCSYDDLGNLFVTGTSSSKSFLMAELRKGSSTFTDITVNGAISAAGMVQWDGTYLALGTNINTKIYRVAVSGSTGTVVSTTTLFNVGHPTYSFFVSEGYVIAPTGRYGNRLGFWRYPKGGKRVNAVGPLYEKHQPVTGITVSKAS